MDAKTLYQQGVSAIRDNNDIVAGRQYLQRSLKLNPRNEYAWLWLTRTTNNPKDKLRYLEKVLQINPNNPSAQKLYQQLKPQTFPTSTQTRRPSKDEQAQINQLLQHAEQTLQQGYIGDALDYWHDVLAIEYDNEEALRQTVRQLVKQKQYDEAYKLIKEVIRKGSEHPSVYLTAIELGHGTSEADRFTLRLVELPDTNEDVLVRTIERYIKHHRYDFVPQLFDHALPKHPDSQKLLFQMADYYEAQHDEVTARNYYEQVVRLGAGTDEGKQADQILLGYAPILTDAERGSMQLAIREALGGRGVLVATSSQRAGRRVAGVRALGYLVYVGVLSAGYYYNLTFVQLGLIDLGTRRVGMPEGQVSAAMAALAVVAFVAAVATGRAMDARGWGADLRVKFRILFLVVAAQTVLTMAAPHVTAPWQFALWVLVSAVGIGAGIPVTFSLMIDFIPVRHRGYVAALVTALAFSAAALYPLEWRIEEFAPPMSLLMVPAAVVLGIVSFRRFPVVDEWARQHERFGVGRFCRPTPVVTASV